jgi:DNA repair protein RecO (recombination protein O)
VAPVRTAAVLLRGYDYGDSSRVLRFYTADHGLLSVMGRGVRGKSGRGETPLASFSSGELAVYLKPQRDLHTMQDFACHRARQGIARGMIRFAGASATAELVLAHAEQASPAGLHPALEAALDRLEDVEDALVPAAVLGGLWTVTGALGFAPQLESCVRCGVILSEIDIGRFDMASGGVRCPACAVGTAGPRVGPRARRQLDELLRGELPSALTHSRRHLGLVSDFVAHHIVPRPLKSFAFLERLLPEDTPTA